METGNVGDILMDMQPPPPPAEVQVLSTKLVEEINSEIQWRLRAIKAEAKIKELQEELDKLQPKEAPK